MKQKATKLDVDAPKLSRKRRAPQEEKSFLVEKQHLNTPMMIFLTIVEYILNP